MSDYEKLQSLIGDIDNLQNNSYEDPNIDVWQRKVINILEKLFGKSTREVQAFNSISYMVQSIDPYITDEEHQKEYLRGLKRAKVILEGVLSDVHSEEVTQPNIQELEKVVLLYEILSNFHKFVQQIKKRHADRATIEITDEYDVQDLLHSLLRIHFNDIRSEDVAPTLAGGHSRPDFILYDEKIGIEVKMMRPTLTEAKVGEQLLVDIAKFSTHPACQSLICFIYDPQCFLTNPQGLVNDLESKGKEMNTKVFISN